MPITENILDHEVIGREFKKGRQEGRQEGLQVGELIVLRRLIAKRFGPLPTQLDERLNRCSSAELEELSDRVLDATNVEDIFNQ